MIVPRERFLTTKAVQVRLDPGSFVLGQQRDPKLSLTLKEQKSNVIIAQSYS